MVLEEGARLLLDGRNIKVQGGEEGNFIGPTILNECRIPKAKSTKLKFSVLF